MSPVPLRGEVLTLPFSSLSSLLPLSFLFSPSLPLLLLFSSSSPLLSSPPHSSEPHNLALLWLPIDTFTNEQLFCLVDSLPLQAVAHTPPCLRVQCADPLHSHPIPSSPCAMWLSFWLGSLQCPAHPLAPSITHPINALSGTSPQPTPFVISLPPFPVGQGSVLRLVLM